MVKVYETAEIGFIVRSRRTELHMTQSQLANMSGVGTRFISDLENGKPTMQVGKVLNFLNLLGLDVSISVRGSAQ